MNYTIDTITDGLQTVAFELEDITEAEAFELFDAQIGYELCIRNVETTYAETTVRLIADNGDVIAFDTIEGK